MSHNRGKKLNAEVLTFGELKRFLESFRPTKAGIRNRAIFATLAFSGLRTDEALSLRIDDVDLERQSAVVICGKGGKRRTVGIGAPAIEALKHWIAIRPNGANYFFCTSKREKLDDSYLRRIARRHGRKAGIRHRVHNHCFRHTSACMMADAGMDIRDIQQQLGHENLSTTDIYLRHINPRRTLEAIRKMDWGYDENRQ